jgi:methyl-accepting chemotaxis protein
VTPRPQSPSAFRARHALANALPGVLAGGLVAVYLAALLQLDAATLRALLSGACGALLLMTPLGHVLERSAQRDVVRALEREARGELDGETLRAGHRAALRLPLLGLAWHALCWSGSGLLVVIWLAAWMRELDGFRSLAILCAAASGGAIVLPVAYYALRALVRPLQLRWAARLPLEDHQQRVVVRLRWKLIAPTAAVCAAIAVFVSLFAHASAKRPVEAHDLRIKAAFLAEAAERLAAGETLDALAESARRLAVADELLRMDAARPAAAPLTPRERAFLSTAPGAAGDSRGLDSTHSFAWQRLAAGDELLVAVTPLAALAAGEGSAATPLLALLLLVLAAALGVSGLLVRDVSGATAQLLAQLERVRAGDLRPAAPLGSDDELGELGLAVAHMSAALRATLARAAGAADRVDEVAAQVSEVGSAVATASASQVSGLERVAAATAAIDRQASGMAESSEALTRSVEEASSSVLELGAAAEQLNHTARALNGQVDDVSGSIEQMVKSVAHVSESTQVLAEATFETSSSLSEMTQSMREVDGHAVETARLSSHVVELAESGRERVRRTVESMESIRSATDGASRVIQGLSERVADIGKVVDVIDDVADETNLLALNAAIIAAQAGEQGRAFSVVADEIKDLADRVLSSTKEIAALIRSVQEESANAADAIQHGTARVREGVELSAGAGAALEEITAAARDCGQRTQEIVSAVREQARATSHVGELMERVSARVGEIRAAGVEQSHANEVVTRSAVVMREVAHQTQRTTEEQARGSARIRDGMEAVRDVVDRIHAALREQSESCRNAVAFLQQIHERTLSHDESAQRLGDTTRTLQHQAGGLRADLQHFRLADEAKASGDGGREARRTSSNPSRPGEESTA